MASIYEAVKRWVQINTTTPNAKEIRAGNVYFTGRHIYSFGSHFEMARAIHGPKGFEFFLVNGDRFSNTTNRHQAEVRNAILRAGAASITIPFSALDAAGIDKDTVEPLDVSQDRTEHIEHVSYERPEGSVWKTEPVMEYVPLPAEEVAELIARRAELDLADWNRRQGWAKAEDASSSMIAWAEANAEPPAAPTVDDFSSYDLRRYQQTSTRQVLYLNGRSWQSIQVVEQGEGLPPTYEWETTRHWLGESLIRATVSTDVRITCEPCAGTGTVMRFAFITPQRKCDECWGNGSRAAVKKRRAKFLSGFDRNERRASYFFCEMPRTRAVTIEDAINALKPDTVKLAEQMGRHVHRQGDIFAVELTGMTKRALRKSGAVFTRRGTLFGTNHEATETAVLPNGTTLARGCLYHNPGFRAADHARVNLGGGWKVIVKNTVPLTA